MNNFGIGDQDIEAMRLSGVGWIFAFLIVGATILGALDARLANAKD